MAVEIPLTRGFVALVDEADAELVLSRKWQAFPSLATCYAKYASDTAPYTHFMHRLIMQPGDGFDVDHINHNGLDNRRCNLRVCTRMQNSWNARRHNKHGFKGIVYLPNRQVYYGRVTLPSRKQFYTKPCKTAEEAAHARDDLALQLHGEFAFLNFPASA